MKAIQVKEFGGPEVLELVEIDEPVAPDGALLIDVEAIGVNYADTHQAENSYLAPAELPLVPGGEVVGRASDGRRFVALLSGGGYAQKAVAWPQAAWEIPDEMSASSALSIVLQGATAWHLLKTSAKLAEGESVVIHAAGGGVGTIAVQLARRWGAGRVIATASTEEKRAQALELGADVAVDSRVHTAEEMNQRLREANEGKKVDVILDMVGGPTTDGGTKALAPFGRHVVYGMAGRVPPKDISVGMLMGTSRAVIGFWLVHCMTRPGMMDAAMTDLISLVSSGELKTIDGGSFPLADARAAHEAIRGRGTTGKLILVP
ncbi:MAG: zinc-binding dehydrogenase [Thermoleophilaceae bacterium]|nr:zinc-binding dehydrogenase [Thermoleophilaceae bacterium]